MNGGKAGNPLSPLNLNAIQEQKTVVFLFEDKSEFWSLQASLDMPRPKAVTFYLQVRP